MLLTSKRQRADKKGKGGDLKRRKGYEERKGCLPQTGEEQRRRERVVTSIGEKAMKKEKVVDLKRRKAKKKKGSDLSRRKATKKGWRPQ